MRVSDSHNDFLTHYKSKQSKINYLYRLSYTDVKIMNAVYWSSERKNPIKDLKENKKILNCAKHINIVYTIEDIGFADISDIKDFVELDIDFCGLVWNFDNKYGGGAQGIETLTTLGEKLVRELEKNNIHIDTAHMNKKTFRRFLNVTKFPIYNSHSNIYSLHNHKRNLKDWQIREIINSNGFIGLSFVKDFITLDECFSSKDIAKQIKYFIERWGIDNIGIGSDFFGTENLPQDLKCYADIKNLEQELACLGISQNIINKVLYENYYNFLKRINKI